MHSLIKPDLIFLLNFRPHFSSGLLQTQRLLSIHLNFKTIAPQLELKLHELFPGLLQEVKNCLEDFRTKKQDFLKLS